MTINREDVVWAYRIMLGRDPESESAIELQQGANLSVQQLAMNLTRTLEFRCRYSLPSSYEVPYFLLPEARGGKIEIREPTLESPTSQGCTVSQMDEPAYAEFCGRVGYDPSVLHRKYWEWAYIARVLDTRDMLRPGRRGVVFAVGAEPLPSLFAARGCEILATDGPPEVGSVWTGSNEYSSQAGNLWRPEICEEAAFLGRVSFREVDMTAIPKDLNGYDFLWSSCSLEHLGSIEAGLGFIQHAMSVLRPGGVAVHTTEFNLTSNDDTIDGWPTSLFRRRDLEELSKRLGNNGHYVEPFNFWPGAKRMDFHIDYPPFAPPHLKVALYQYVSTSFGIIVIKDGQASTRIRTGPIRRGLAAALRRARALTH